MFRSSAIRALYCRTLPHKPGRLPVNAKRMGSQQSFPPVHNAQGHGFQYHPHYQPTYPSWNKPDTKLPFTWMVVSLFSCMGLAGALRVDPSNIKDLVVAASFEQSRRDQALGELLVLADLNGGWGGFPSYIPQMVDAGIIDTLLENLANDQAFSASMELLTRLFSEKKFVKNVIFSDEKKLQKLLNVLDTVSEDDALPFSEACHIARELLLHAKKHGNKKQQQVVVKSLTKFSKDAVVGLTKNAGKEIEGNILYSIHRAYYKTFDSIWYTLFDLDRSIAIDFANEIAKWYCAVSFSFDVYGTDWSFEWESLETSMKLNAPVAILRAVERELPDGKKLSDVVSEDGYLLIRESELPESLRNLETFTWKWLGTVEHTWFQRKLWDVSERLPESALCSLQILDVWKEMACFGFSWGFLRAYVALYRLYTPPVEYFKANPAQGANGLPPFNQASGSFGQPGVAGYGQPAPGTAGFGQPAPGTAGFGQPAPGTAGFGQPGTAGYGQHGAAGFGQPGTAGYGQHGTAGFGQPGTAGYGQPGTAGYGQPGTAGYGQPGTAGYGQPAPNNAPHNSQYIQFNPNNVQNNRGVNMQGPMNNQTPAFPKTWRFDLAFRYGIRAGVGSTLLVALMQCESWVREYVWIEDPLVSKAFGSVTTLFNSAAWLATLKALPYSFAVPFFLYNIQDDSEDGGTSGRLLNISVEFSDGDEGDDGSDSSNGKGGKGGGGRWA